MKNQPRIPGYRRTPMGTAVITEIERAIRKEMKRYDVSRSFVIANALAFTFGISTASYITSKEAPAKNVVRFRKQKAG
jgi:hypothetical protein